MYKSTGTAPGRLTLNLDHTEATWTGTRETLKTEPSNDSPADNFAVPQTQSVAAGRGSQRAIFEPKKL